METESKISLVSYPREINANVDFRHKLFVAASQDNELAADVRRTCQENIMFWIDLFCWTKDPRKDPDILPFITYDAYQRDSILEIEMAIDKGYDLLGEKSRDMGFSWMVLYVFEHKWLFETGSDFRLGSRKEEFVDRIGDIDTLFEKLRFNLERQPRFLMPPKFDWRKHSGYMKLLNPYNGNAMIGEAANENFGSGGRRKAALLDEFSKWEPRVANGCWTSMADVTKCRIPISTPKGSGNKFAILAKGTKEKIRKLTLHWTLHPEKSKGAYYFDSDGKTKIMIDLEDPRMAFNIWQRGKKVRSIWYDAECERRSATDVAQELDINYLQSGAPFFDIEALAKQKAWKFFKRALPMSPIPAQRYIRGTIVELDNKYELREVDGGWIKIFELPKEGMQYVNCLPDNELVMTNKGEKFIQNVKLSDKLINQDGKSVKIVNIQKRAFEGKVYEIVPNMSLIGTKFTGEHPICILKDNKIHSNTKKVNGKWLHKRFYYKKEEWKDAKDIKKGDILSYPLPYQKKGKSTKILNRMPVYKARAYKKVDPKILLDKDFWFLTGLYLADGWRDKNYRGRKSCGRIGISLNAKKEMELAKSCKEKVKKIFNRTLNIYKSQTNTLIISFSCVQYHIFLNQFGNGAHNKFIPEWVKYLPKDLKIALIKGYLAGDGCINKDYSSQIVSVSRKLLEDCQDILLSCGYLSSIKYLRKEIKTHVLNGRKIQSGIAYSLSIPSREICNIYGIDKKFVRKRHCAYGWIEDKRVYLKVKNVKVGYYCGYVNNFETETHSYCAKRIAVHNCGDTAEGLAKGDECFGIVRDKFTRNVCATYHGCFSPDDFAIKAQKVGQYYNNAKTAIENNNHGYSTNSDLRKMDCNLYYTRNLDSEGKSTVIKAGWTTTARSRPQMLDQLEEEIRKDCIELRDSVLISQCETFVKNEKTGKPEADGDYFDDGVIALAIGGMVIQEFPYQAPVKKKTGVPQHRRPKNARFRFSRKK